MRARGRDTTDREHESQESVSITNIKKSSIAVAESSAVVNLHFLLHFWVLHIKRK